MCGSRRENYNFIMPFFQRIDFGAADTAAALLPITGPPRDAVDSQTPVQERSDQRQGQIKACPDQRRTGIALEEQGMACRRQGEQAATDDKQCDQEVVKDSAQIDLDLFTIQLDRKCRQHEFRMFGTFAVGQVETVPMPGA